MEVICFVCLVIFKVFDIVMVVICFYCGVIFKVESGEKVGEYFFFLFMREDFVGKFFKFFLR